MIAETTTELKGYRSRWRLETPIPAELRAALGGESVMIAHLLYCRGFDTIEQIQDFFTQGLISHDPSLLPDMDAAVARIAAAVARRERVAIYGDFDCDGLTSVAVLIETLRAIGLQPVAHIPTREDGHGLQPEGLAGLAEAGVTLVVTADCGVSAIEEVRVAQGMGMDVIITDHHEPRADGSLPACPVINPTRHDSEYPCRHLCGVGVAYKLAQALADRYPGTFDPAALLDLVVLGTVADVAVLRDENRSLVIEGLRCLRRTTRPGLLALFEAAGVDRAKIDPISVGFYLAPRINAANRMASPQLAYDLITATDPVIAAGRARELSTHNQRRQLLVATTFETIAEGIGDPHTLLAEVRAGRRAPLLLVVGEWPAGISGLLASKLVDTYGLPAFVGSAGGDGTVSVSGRGMPGVHVDELLERCEAALPAGLFLNHGGHSGAGGFRVQEEKFAVARAILEEQGTASIVVDEIGAILTVDARVSLSQLTLEAARRVRALAPFGMGFPEPLFLVERVQLKRVSPLRDGKHVKLALLGHGNQVEGVFFNAPEEFRRLSPGAVVDVVGHLQIDEWQGRSKPQLCVRDWRESDGRL